MMPKYIVPYLYSQLFILKLEPINIGQSAQTNHYPQKHSLYQRFDAYGLHIHEREAPIKEHSDSQCFASQPIDRGPNSVHYPTNKYSQS